MPYAYEARPTEGRLPKHKWAEPQAGVVVRNGLHEGKCPAGMSPQVLLKLLNEGIAYYAKDCGDGHPHSIFNVHGGVPYRAVRTNAGLSYHGFPCVGARRDVPPAVMKQLLAKAAKMDCLKQVERWFKDHP